MRDAEITVPAMNAPKIGSMPSDAVVTAPAKMMITAAATVGPGSSARVVTVSTFRTEEEEAIALANGTEYGLGGGLWTTDLSRAHRVAAAMRSGMI